MSLRSIILLIFTLFIFSCEQLPKSQTKLNDEFQEKFRKIISQDDQTTTAQSYEDIREIVRVEMINQIIFK